MGCDVINFVTKEVIVKFGTKEFPSALTNDVVVAAFVYMLKESDGCLLSHICSICK